MNDDIAQDVNNDTMDNGSNSSGTKTALMLSAFLVLAAVVMFVLYRNNQNGNTESLALATQESILGTTNNPAVIEEAQGNTVDVNMGMFYFDPKEITVKAGETLRINLTNTEGQHDFVIDELNVQSSLLEQEGQTETITFTPTQPGEYEYYCSVGEHRQMGMVGKLIVE